MAPSHSQAVSEVSSTPLLDLSAEGIESFLSEIVASINNIGAGIDKPPLSNIISLLREILQSFEGLFIPKNVSNKTQQLAASLQDVLVRQSIVLEKLSGLEKLTREDEQLGEEKDVIKRIAERLWEQYLQLQQTAASLMQQLQDLLLSLLPDLRPILQLPNPTDALQQREVIDNVKQLFPNILN